MRYLTALTILFFAAGCTHGPAVSSLPYITAPIGSDATFSVAGTKMTAELLAVQDSGYLFINREDRVVFVPFASVQNLRIPTLGRGVSGPPSEASRRALRLASRYPQGVSPGILMALLARRSQPAVERIQ